MSENQTQYEHHCRWCGRTYYGDKPNERDDFCEPPCKRALINAYHGYVTVRKVKKTTQKPDQKKPG